MINGALLTRAWAFLGLLSSLLVMAGFLFVLLRAGWSPGDATGRGTALNDDYRRATSMTFAGIVSCQVGTALASRTEHASLRSIGLLSNRLLLWGIAFELLFAAAVIYVPALQTAFGTQGLAVEDLAFIAPFRSSSGERTSGGEHGCGGGDDRGAPPVQPHPYPPTDPARGLTGDEARARRAQDGPNSPSPVERPAYGRLVLRQLRDPLVALLIAAAAFAAASGDRAEAIAIGAIVLVNTILGFWQESRAEEAIRALAESFTQTARVVRDGVELEIVAADVVRGDLLVFDEGDRVAADARLLEATALEVDESALTGESCPSASARRPRRRRPRWPSGPRWSTPARA